MSASVEEELSPTVLAALKKVLGEKGISNYEYKVSAASSAGENSYGQVLRLKITSKEDASLSTSFIAKSSPKNEARRKQMKVAEHYSREVFIYEKVLPQFFKIQEEYQITKTDMFDGVPAMYYHSLDERNEFILFEDLEESEYWRYNRRQCLTFDHTALAVKELAKFHSMSLVLKEKKPELFSQLVAEIKYDNLFTEDMEEVSIKFAKKHINKTIQIIEHDAPNMMHLVEVLETIRDDFVDICINLVNGDEAEPHSVICHGDFWNNNILYRYDENGIPISAKILDFQVSRYSSPALDFMHYLFVCTEKTLRDQYFEDLKKIYHQTISNQLELFNLEVDEIFSFHSFEAHLSTFGVYGFCIAAFAIPFVISDSKDIPDLDKAADAVLQLKTNDSDEDKVSANICDQEVQKKCSTEALLDEYEMLTEATIPIFRRRMLGIVLDMDQHKMLVDSDFF